MELTVLGCGDAFGSGGRFNTSFLVRNDIGEGVLLDCGASTLIRLKSEKVRLATISTIIITHFHGDHYGGLPFFLISSMFEEERKEPLTIVGPRGIKERVMQLQEAMYAGTAEKLSMLDLSFVEFVPLKEIAVGDKKITAYPVEHSPPSDPHGVRLEWNKKIIGFSGDTSWTDHLIDLADHADVFICECNFMDQVSFGHLSYGELLRKKKQFNCKQLWLTHMNEEVYNHPELTMNRLSDGLKITV